MEHKLLALHLREREKKNFCKVTCHVAVLHGRTIWLKDKGDQRVLMILSH